MSIHILEAYRKLANFERCLFRHDYALLYSTVRACPVLRVPMFPDVTERVCAALDMATIWYWKEVRCLQRSAALSCLLRAHGIPAQMVIGAQITPFKSHAWVEVDNCVVGDRPHARELYAVLDRV
jgi:hypothetical protein